MSEEETAIELGGESDGEQWSMFVAGDYALSREERPTAKGTVSSSLRERIAGADVSVLNFEAPIVPSDSTPIDKSGPAIENPPAAAQAVADAGFDVCTLANNHVRDYGPEGVATTVAALQDVGCETVGVGENHDAAFEPLEISQGEASIGVINVCEREFNIAGEDSDGAAWIADRRARETVRKADREYDSVIVVAHGGAEYVPVPSPELQGLLREFVDIGADLVVAHHPHVPQGWERYGEGAIFYSLGNFLFDSMADAANTSWGLSLEVEFAGSTPVAVDLVPTEMVDGVVVPLGSPAREERLADLHRLSEITADADTLEAYWQEVAVQTFYRRYSNWLHMGVGVNLSRARADPNDPAAQRPVWDPEARRREIMALLTIVRTESHRWVMTNALGVLTGETEDRRTPDVRQEARELLSRTVR